MAGGRADRRGGSDGQHGAGRGAWRNGTSAPLVVADAGSDEAMGLVNLRFTDAGTTIAYSVFPEHRGKGVAPRAVELAVGWAFGVLGLTELRLEADEGNAASIRVAEKCGFVETASRRNRDGTTTRAFTRNAG